MPGTRTKLIESFQHVIVRVIGKYKTADHVKGEVGGVGFFVTNDLIVTALSAVAMPCGAHRHPVPKEHARFVPVNTISVVIYGLNNGDYRYRARILIADPTAGIAFLLVEPCLGCNSKLPALTGDDSCMRPLGFGDSEAVRCGSDLYFLTRDCKGLVAARHFNVQRTNAAPFSPPMISSFVGSIDNYPAVPFEAQAGSPIVDACGNLLGVFIPKCEYLTATPSKIVALLLTRITAEKRDCHITKIEDCCARYYQWVHGDLGIVATQVCAGDYGCHKCLALCPLEGYLIRYIDECSPAHKKLHVGDIVLKVNDRVVGSNTVPLSISDVLYETCPKDRACVQFVTKKSHYCKTVDCTFHLKCSSEFLCVYGEGGNPEGLRHDSSDSDYETHTEEKRCDPAARTESDSAWPVTAPSSQDAAPAEEHETHEHSHEDPPRGHCRSVFRLLDSAEKKQ